MTKIKISFIKVSLFKSLIVLEPRGLDLNVAIFIINEKGVDRNLWCSAGKDGGVVELN